MITVLKSVARISLMKSVHISVCVYVCKTVNCKCVNQR
jgi:hypothetical protein